MLVSSSGRIALKGEGGVARTPALRHRNLIHTSLLTALLVHKHSKKKAERTPGLIFKARLRGWKKIVLSQEKGICNKINKCLVK